MGAGHARESNLHFDAESIRGHGPLLPVRCGGTPTVGADRLLWERPMPVKLLIQSRADVAFYIHRDSARWLATVDR